MISFEANITNFYSLKYLFLKKLFNNNSLVLYLNVILI